ncbi:MAG: NAD(P)/FAD-dependent oxidoreductase [Firmicutes bacterium]|nr:NAD(P)/FAD-dependent oxidoreductase [Bacillota bacterium]
MEYKTDLLILGTGAAGSSAAFAARKQCPDLSIWMISREDEPEYSEPALPDLLSGELSMAKVRVKNWEEYRNAGIDVRCREAVQIDAAAKKVFLDGGDTVSYGALILATGSQPIRLRKMQGTGLPGNFVMKSLADVLDLEHYHGKSAVVVGSGAIGIEGSMALKARGFERVTMVEALDWLSPRSLDRETSDKLQAALEGFGVEVLTGEAVQAVLGEDKVEGVETSKRRIPCDVVLWGIGMRPDVQLAKDAGVELGALGGIRVDDRMRTSIPHIYACGDCAESLDILSGQPALHLFWEPAQRGGAAAGVNAAGGDVPYLGSAAVFLTNKGGLSIAALGKTAAELDPCTGRILQEEKDGLFRRLLLEDGYLKGVQMLGTLTDIDLFFENIRKNAMQREGAWDLRVQIPEDCTTVREAIFFLRKSRRNAI